MAKPDALLRVRQWRAAITAARDVKTFPTVRILSTQALE